MDKISITIDPATVEEIDVRGKNRSGTIQQSLDRYYDLLARQRRILGRQFNAKQSGLILDALNGSIYEPFSIPYVTASIAEAMDLDGLGEKWQVDRDQTLDLLANHGKNYVANLAIVDAAERWWYRQSHGAIQTPEEMWG